MSAQIESLTGVIATRLRARRTSASEMLWGIFPNTMSVDDLATTIAEAVNTHLNPPTIVDILTLPWEKPPMSMNDRPNRWAKAASTKDIRDTVCILAKAAHLPRDCQHVTVGLHYAPPDNRRRDEDNLMATAKAAFDGLVDHGLVPDDVPAYMQKLMPVIHPKSTTGKGQLWLEIEVTQ